MKTFGYGKALKFLKKGKKLARTGWNGKNMFVYYVPGGDYPAQTEAAKSFQDENGCVHYEPYLAIKNVKNTVNTWVPSISDILANDWFVRSEKKKKKAIQKDYDFSNNMFCEIEVALMGAIPQEEEKND